MFKRWIALAISLMMTITLFAACSGSGSTEGTAEPKKDQAAPAKGAKFVFWDKSEYVKDYNEMQKARVEKFGKDNNIEVEYVIIPPNDLKSKLLASLEGGNPPDLVVTDDFLAKQFTGMNALTDVSDVVSKLDLTDAAKNIAYVKKGSYIVPQALLAPGMYVRKDKWEEKGQKLPDTWQDMLDTARQVNDPKNNFYALGLPMGASGGGDAEGMMRCIILGYGGVPVDKDGNIKINSPETLEAMTLMATIFKEKLTPDSSITWDDSANNKAYQAATAGIIMNSGSVFSTLKKENPDLLAKTTILPFPAGPKGRFIPGGGNVFIVFNKGKNNTAAKKFMTESFFDKDYYGSLVEKIDGMWQPVIKGYENTPFWQKPENKGWIEASKNVVPNTYPAEADELSTKAFSEQLVVKAMQKIIVNNMDPQKALNELEAEFKRVYKK